VPGFATRPVSFAGLIRGKRHDGGRDEIEQVAAQLGMQAYYAPSMRNGAPLVSDEDRGNAILTNLRMTDTSAHELPFERQRRVAVAATVHGVRTNGEPWSLRVASVHLDNMVGARRLWIAGAEYGRVRQTRGLLRSLGATAPMIVGGDFNTWFGFADSAYREAQRAFPQTRVSDRRATFGGLLRLDHLFYRLPAGWTFDFSRASDRFGSDHYPLIATLTIQ
jgi:endonuclease/exonuclease/phosphatase family metal-dependent hydrolase